MCERDFLHLLLSVCNEYFVVVFSILNTHTYYETIDMHESYGNFVYFCFFFREKKNKNLMKFDMVMCHFTWIRLLS